jgi:hypothetical protein
MLELWDITPRLGFFSAEPGSGKSRALEVSKLTACLPFPSASLTGPVLMRQIDSGDYATIIIDQLEDIYSSAQARDANGSLTTVLSAGFESDAVAHRCEANTNKPQEFKIYAPVVMAGLSRTKLPDSLKSRTLRIEMKRRFAGDEIAEFRKRYAAAEAKPIREALEEWCFEMQTKIDLDALKFPPGIRDRDKDIWEPLFAIAQVAGNDWPKRVADAARAFVGARVDDSADSMGLRLLRDCVSIMEAAHTCEPNWLRNELFNMSDAPLGAHGARMGRA